MRSVTAILIALCVACVGGERGDPNVAGDRVHAPRIASAGDGVHALATAPRQPLPSSVVRPGPVVLPAPCPTIHAPRRAIVEAPRPTHAARRLVLALPQVSRGPPAGSFV